MPTASRQVRKLRRIKRERTLAYKGMDLAISQRDQAKLIAAGLEMELKKYAPGPEDSSDNLYPEGEDPTPIIPAPATPSLTIRRIKDEETEGINVGE